MGHFHVPPGGEQQTRGGVFKSAWKKLPVRIEGPPDFHRLFPLDSDALI